MRLDNIEKMLHCIFWLLFLLHIRLFPCSSHNARCNHNSRACGTAGMCRHRPFPAACCPYSWQCQLDSNTLSAPIAVQPDSGLPSSALMEIFFTVSPPFSYFSFSIPPFAFITVLCLFTQMFRKKKALKHNPLLNTF